jgi:RNA polymerase primary sigma factor
VLVRNVGRQDARGPVPGSHGPRVANHESPARPGLPPALERELVAAAAAGDAAASARLVEAFQPAIAGVAHRYRSFPAVSRAELMQEGVVGLLRALRRYDPRLGRPFWAYASWWVRQAMQQHVAEMTGPVVLSDRAHRMLARVREARRQFLQDHGRDPSMAELCEATELTRDQVESLIAIEQTPRALEEPVGDKEDGADTLEAFVADPVAEDDYERVLEQMEIEDVRDLTEALSEREREILRAHYGLGRRAQTLSEIGDHLGVSAERVRQIEEAALEKLRVAAASGAPLGGTSSRPHVA